MIVVIRPFVTWQEAGGEGRRYGDVSCAGSSPATPHELSMILIELEREVSLWQTQMKREIRPNPLGSRPDSRVDSRADNKGNPINRPVNSRARCRPGSKGNEAAGWHGAVRSRRPCLRSARAPSSA